MRAWRYADRCGYDPGRCRRLGIHAAAARQVRPLYERFVSLARAQGLPADERPDDDDALAKCLLAAFSDQLAVRLDAGTLRCRMVHGRAGRLARESVVRAPLFVAAEVREIGGREVSVQLSLATAVEEAWLRAYFPDAFAERVEAVYDRAAGRVVAERRLCFRDLVLASRPLEPPPADEAARLLAAAVLAGDAALPRWDHAVEQWILRVNLLAEACPELGLAPVGAEERRRLVQQLCLGAVSAKDLKERPVLPAVRAWLGPALAPLVDRHAPAEIALPGGGRARVQYAAGAPPKISKRVQDLYGLRASPRVAMGRVPVVVEVLGPHFRPVQTTADMEGFWRDTYPGVKRELQRRYPKHLWR